MKKRSTKLRGKEYWKPFWSVFLKYLNHPEFKMDGDTGMLERKHVNVIGMIHIGKESNNLEESEVLGISKKDTIEYVNQQKRMRSLIENLTEEKARELEIPRRTYFDLQKKIKGNKPIKLKDKTLYKILNVVNWL